MAEQPVTVELFYGGDWHDHTAEVFTADPVTVVRGRPAGGDLTPGSATFTLDNRTGRFNPKDPASDLFGLIGRNTAVRIGMRHGFTSGVLADVADDFSTPVSGSWGTPDVGPAWTEYGAGGSVLTSDFQVAAGFGTHYVPVANAYRACRLDGLLIVDCTQVLDFKCPQATGASLEPANLMLRGTDVDNFVLARVEVTTANAVVCRIYSADDTLLGSATVPSLTHAGIGTPLRVKARAVGRDVFMRVWNPAGAEPSVWHLQVTDDTAAPTAGYVGVRSGRAASNTNATNPQFSYDTYTVTVDDPIFVGEVASWKPGSTLDFDADTGRGKAWTFIEAAGVLRRVSQGDDPIDSAARKAIATADISLGDLWAYWPLEDDAHALSAASLVDGVPAMRPVGTSQFQAPGTGGALPPAGLPKFAAGTGPAGSAALVSLTEGGRLDAHIDSVATGALQQHWEAHWTMTHESGAEEALASEPLLLLTEGTAARWLIDVTGTEVTVFASDADDNTIDSMSATVNHYDGTAHVYNVFASNTVMGDVTAGLWIDGVAAASMSMVGETVGPVRTVTINPVEARGDHQASAFGQLAIFRGLLSATETVAIADAMHGNPGEAAGRRLERLCLENTVAFAAAGDLDATLPMAAQREGKLGEHVGECERTDAGLVVEPAQFVGLRYVTREEFYNRAAALTVDRTQLAPGLQPIVDELGVFNDVTAERPDGAWARAIVTSGPMNINSPADDADGIGRYKTKVDVNPEDPSRLQDLASWYLAQSTVDRIRYEEFTIDLVAAPDLAVGVAGVDPGDVLEVTGLEPETVRLLVSQVRHVIGSHTRTVTFIGAPADAYDIGVWNDSGSRYDTSYSTVAADFDAGTDTALSVATETGRTLWCTGSGGPRFPFHVRARGVVLNVTAISGASSPQTFTVDAAPVNGITGVTIAAGERVRLADPVRYGM